MRRLLFPLLILLFLCPVSAQVCNLGTMQPVTGYSAVPGATLEAKVYIYNLYGEKILHVLVDPDTIIMPQGWTYTFEPEASYVTYNIPGGTTQVYENLDVEPMAATNDTSLYQDVEYLTSPSMIGYYIPAKVLTLKLDIPTTAPLWKTYDFSFSVRGWCTSDSPGAVGASQQRDFNFQVRTVALEYFEERVVSPLELLAQYAVYIALVVAIVITLIVLFVLRKMGKLIIKVEVK
jgi:preprotein translocase subunit Sec61beta